MNIQEIKTKLGVQTLPLQIVTTQTGEPTSWLRIHCYLHLQLQAC